MAQLEKLKTRLEIQPSDTSQDAKLEAILEDVEADMLAFTNRTELLPKMLGLQIKIALIEYNKQGSEGMSADSQGGVSHSWIDGLPKDVYDALVECRRLKVANYATAQS